MSSMGDLAAILGGAPGSTAMPPGAAADVPMDDSATADDSTQYATSADALDGAEDALHAFIQLDPDPADRAQAGKALQIVLALQASAQQSNQNGDMSSFARALQQGPPPGGPGGAMGGP